LAIVKRERETLNQHRGEMESLSIRRKFSKCKFGRAIDLSNILGVKPLIFL
jgi:hypothetical protein